MSGRPAFALVGLVVLAAISLPGAVHAADRDPACVRANDRVTQLRIGRTRTGQSTPLNVANAVKTGETFLSKCNGDDNFMLAFALARVDLSAQVKFGTPDQRAKYFNSAVRDLTALDGKVRSGRSDHYEIFNVLGLVYYEAGQYQKAIDELRGASPFLSKMTAASAQKTLVTLGVAFGQLGQNDAGAKAFDQAVTFGYPAGKANDLKRKTLGARWAIGG